MNEKKHKEYQVGLVRRLSNSRLSGLLLSIAVLLLSVKIVFTENNTRTVFIPPQVHSQFWLENDKVDHVYLEQMSRFIIGLLLTYNKQNARSQFDSALFYFHPSIHGQWKAKLNNKARRIKRNDLASVFFVYGIHMKGNTAYINGRLEGIVGKKRVAEREVTYKLQFEHANGTSYIRDFYEVTFNSVAKTYQNAQQASESELPEEDEAQFRAESTGVAVPHAEQSVVSDNPVLPSEADHEQ